MCGGKQECFRETVWKRIGHFTCQLQIKYVPCTYRYGVTWTTLAKETP
jgi:hypothetical protein